MLKVFGKIITGLAAIMATAPAPSIASEFTPERFLTECQAGFTKLAERARHCHGRYTLIDGGMRNNYAIVREIEFAVSDDQLLVKTKRSLSDDPEIQRFLDRQAVRAVNEDYSFHISSEVEGEYRLESHVLAADVESDPLGGEIRRIAYHWLSPVNATHCIGFFPLKPLLEHPSFRLVNLTDRTRDGVPVVRAEFTAKPGEPETDPLVSWTRDKVFGWFEVAPTQGWTVRAFEYTYFAAAADPKVPLAKARVRGDIDYAPGADGLPVVTHYKQSTAWRDLPPDPYIEIKDIEMTFGPTPDEEFRLSYYGLPEPVGVAPLPKEGIPTYVWALAAAGVFAAAALAFRWFSRRGGSANPETSPGA